MDKVNRELATNEVNSWLDSKKIRPKKRESYSTYVETLVDAICDGVLTYNRDNHTFVHVLNFPLSGDGEISVDKIVYKNRVNTFDVEPYLRNVKSTDSDGRLIAWICALTGRGVGIIKNLDTEDLSIGQSIAIFFL
jgi:hypothetical protein